MKKPEAFEAKVVKMCDFMSALQEVKPDFGMDENSLDNCIREGIIDTGARFRNIYDTCNGFIHQQTKEPLLTILLEGDNGCGKTALAAHLASKSQFPYVKLITPENFVGFTEMGKVAAITKIFDDAYKSPLSLIILDDIERLIEYIHLGPRFSNVIL
jgi:vesicle-fusing ATPase